MKWLVPDINDLPGVAHQIINLLPKYATVCFHAPMGAGKTTLISHLCRELGSRDDINSPTFAIINEYTTNSGDTLFHFDFYRIEAVDELLDLGVEDYFEAPAWKFVEWPDRAGTLLPENIVNIYISIDSEDQRIIELEELS